jgi:hypothetical protein
VPLALGAFAVIEGLGRGISQGGERGQEHGVLEPVVASPASGLGVEAGAGLPGDRGEAGVGGELSAAGEAGAVADLCEDPRAGARAYSWQGCEDLTERVREERLLDLLLQRVPPRVDPVQLGRELGDDPPGRRLGRDGDVLRGQGLRDRLGRFRRQPWRPAGDRLPDLVRSGGAQRRQRRERGDQVPDAGVLEPVPERPLHAHLFGCSHPGPPRPKAGLLNR